MAGILLVGLTGTSLLGVATASHGNSCERPYHDCAKAVLTDCCCQEQPAATAALSAFVDIWSSVTKLHWHSTSWTTGVVTAEHAAEIAFAVILRAGQASPPVPPVSPTRLLTILLI